MTDLKPCPFCGGEAEFKIFDTICNVECSECFNGTRYYALDDYEQVVAAWNARAERTCRVDGSYYDELWNETCTHLSCGHDVWGEVRNYCPECGAKVVKP